MANKLTLDILGASFSIRAEEDEAYLQNVLTQYKAAVKKTQSISGIKEPLNAAVLTGFLLCDEINKMKQQLKNETLKSTEAEQITLNMLAKLEQAGFCEAAL